MAPKSQRSLQDVVGKETYSIWVDMLRELVPEGRTHRLSVVIAGMLQYALDKSAKVKHRNEDKHSVALSLIDAGYPDGVKELIHDVVDRLFKDAGVSHERVSKRGEHYSVADEAYNEFASWFDYPWD
ncbi:MAG: hypothetical protein ACXW4M_04815 [Anaerolineales bacterium]